MPEIKIPKKEEVPAKVKITFEETQEKQEIESTDISEKTLASFIETAKNNEEVTRKIAELIFSSLDVKNFKEKLIEEALRDSELRNKIMLELLKKL